MSESILEIIGTRSEENIHEEKCAERKIVIEGRNNWSPEEKYTGRKSRDGK